MAMQRVHYFNTQFLKQEEFRDEQSYNLGMRRALTRGLHSPGIGGDGLEVYKSGPLQITVKPGVAIDAQGRAIVIDADTTKDLTVAPKNVPIWITIRYDEQPPPPPDPTKDTGTHMRTVEAPIIDVATALPTDNVTIPLATFTITTEIPGDTTTPLDGGVRAAHMAGAGLASGSVKIAALDPDVVKQLTQPDVIAGIKTRLDGIDTLDTQMGTRQDQLSTRQDQLGTRQDQLSTRQDQSDTRQTRIESLVGDFGIISGLGVSKFVFNSVQVDGGQARDAAGHNLSVPDFGVTLDVPGLDRLVYTDGNKPPYTRFWVTVASNGAGITPTRPPADGTVVLLGQFDLHGEDQGDGVSTWEVPDGALDGGVRRGLRTTLKGDVALQGALGSPLWNVTQVFNNKPGPLPASGSFPWSGGTLLLFISGSSYRTDGGGVNIMTISIDKQTPVATAYVGVNDTVKHHALVANALVVPAGPRPPSTVIRTLDLDQTNGMATDSADYFCVTVLELPF